MNSRESIIKKYCECELYNGCVVETDIEYDPNKPTMLILDDQESVITLFRKLLRKMKLLDKFNIIMLSGEDVAIKILKLLNLRQDVDIDIIITDITYGGSVKIGDKIVDYDGVELVGILKELFPKLLYRFLTGHNVTEVSTPWIYEKYSKYADDDVLEHTSIKDKPITSNKDLILKTVKGSEYEKLVVEP